MQSTRPPSDTPKQIVARIGSNWNEPITLRYGEAIIEDDLVMDMIGWNLYIGVKAPGDTTASDPFYMTDVVVITLYTDSRSAVEVLEFSDGTSMALSEATSRFGVTYTAR